MGSNELHDGAMWGMYNGSPNGSAWVAGRMVGVVVEVGAAVGGDGGLGWKGL